MKSVAVICLLVGVALASPDPEMIKQCMLDSDAFDCCDFPKAIPEPIVRRCIQDMVRNDRQAGIRRPGPPGGMCLFKCFAEKAGYLKNTTLNEAAVLQGLQAAAYASPNSTAWLPIVRKAVPTAYVAYSNMIAKMSANDTDNDNDKDCCPSNGYFLARTNAELFVNCPVFLESSPKCVDYRKKVKNCTVFIAKPQRLQGAGQMGAMKAMAMDSSDGVDGNSGSGSAEDGGSSLFASGLTGAAAGAGGAGLVNALSNNKNKNEKDSVNPASGAQHAAAAAGGAQSGKHSNTNGKQQKAHTTNARRGGAQSENQTADKSTKAAKAKASKASKRSDKNEKTDKTKKTTRATTARSV